MLGESRAPYRVLRALRGLSPHLAPTPQSTPAGPGCTTVWGLVARECCALGLARSFPLGLPFAPGLAPQEASSDACSLRLISLRPRMAIITGHVENRSRNTEENKY